MRGSVCGGGVAGGGGGSGPAFVHVCICVRTCVCVRTCTYMRVSESSLHICSLLSTHIHSSTGMERLLTSLAAVDLMAPPQLVKWSGLQEEGGFWAPGQVWEN
jgi:hypothetical protein